MSEYTAEIPQRLRDEEAAAEAKLTQLTDEAGESDETTADEHVSSDVTPSPRDTEGEDWKHKYEVLQGKYNAELPRALHDAAYWRDRAGQLQEQVDRLSAAHQASGQETPVEGDDDLNDWLGEDGSKAVRQWMERQKADIEARVGRAESVAKQTAEGAFWSKVNQAFPDYGRMVQDPGLNQWLSESWPGVPVTRMQQAQQLAGALNADEFIALLRAYNPANDGRRPPTMPSPTPTRAAGSGTPPPAGKSLTPADMEAIGQRLRIMKSTGRHQEAAALEREFDAAIREGRIGV